MLEQGPYAGEMGISLMDEDRTFVSMEADTGVSGSI